MEYSKHGESTIFSHNNILIISLVNGFNKEGMEQLLLDLQKQRDKLNKEPFIQIMIVDEMALATQDAIKSAFMKAADKDNYDPLAAFIVTKSSIVKDIMVQFSKRPGSRKYPYYLCDEIDEVFLILESEKYLSKEEISSLKDSLKI